MADPPADPAPPRAPSVHVVPVVVLPPDPTSPEIRGYPREAVKLITSFGLEVHFCTKILLQTSSNSTRWASHSIIWSYTLWWRSLFRFLFPLTLPCIMFRDIMSQGSRRNNVLYIADGVLIHSCGDIVHFLDLKTMTYTFRPVSPLVQSIYTLNAFVLTQIRVSMGN